MGFQFVDGEGKIPVARMRECFEEAITNTPAFAKCTPLGPFDINDEFYSYMDGDTDTMWIGFALGMRCYERMVKAAATEPKVKGE